MKSHEKTNTPRTDAAKDLWESPYRLHGEGEDGWATAAKFEVELAAAQQKLEQAEAERDDALEWKREVQDQLVVCHIYHDERHQIPRCAVNELIDWNCKVALDPRVSSDASALIENFKVKADDAQLSCIAAQEECELLRKHAEQAERRADEARVNALEEAAKVCDSVNNYDNPMTAADCAQAIRNLKEPS